jgi:cation transport ATPase
VRWEGAEMGAAVMGNIRQIFFFAFVHNAARVPITAGVISLSSVSAIGNALSSRWG